MGFTIAVHIPIAALSLLPLLLGFPILFTPVHIAFLELIIDPVCSIVFEAEPEEGDVMRRPPRDSTAPLFASALMAWSAFQGVCILLVVGTFFVGLLHLGLAEAEARAAAFVALVAANFSLVVVDRSFGAALAAALRRPNPAFWRIFALVAALLAAALALPALRTLFHFALPPGATLAAALGLGLGVMLLLELAKAATRGRSAAKPV
jgi:Ca2+-transporting ATPase